MCTRAYVRSCTFSDLSQRPALRKLKNVNLVSIIYEKNFKEPDQAGVAYIYIVVAFLYPFNEIHYVCSFILARLYVRVFSYIKNGHYFKYVDNTL